MKELVIKKLQQKRELLLQNHSQAYKTFIDNPTIKTHNDVITSLTKITAIEGKILLLGGKPNEHISNSNPKRNSTT